MTPQAKQIEQLQNDLKRANGDLADLRLDEIARRQREIATVVTNVAGVGVAGSLGVLLAALSAMDEADWLGSLILSALFVGVVLPLISLCSRWEGRIALTLVATSVLCAVGKFMLHQQPMDLIPVVTVCVVSILPDIVIDLTPRLLEWLMP